MPQVERITRVGDAYERLRKEILANRLPPGFQATEPDIANWLGMSRTPVREALIRLQAEGLVDLIPRHGARVRPILPEDMKEIYEILTALEPDAAALLASKRPSNNDLAPLEKATREMEAALEANDLDAWAEADDQFHCSFLELHGNRRLTEFVTLLNDQAHRARIATLRIREKPIRSTQDHREILEHIRSGNGEAARMTFRTHRLRVAAELLAIIAKYHPPQPQTVNIWSKQPQQ